MTTFHNMLGGTGAIFICLCMILTIEWTHAALVQCDRPLGFENGNITDRQFSDSTHGRSMFTPEEARLNVGKGWVAQHGDKHYLKVDLLTEHQITGYSIQGGGYSIYTSYSKTVALYYSQEGVIWDRYISSDGRDTIEGNTDSTSVKTFNLTPPVQARYVAFSPKTWFGYPSLRLELYECEEDNPITVKYTAITSDIKDSQEWLLSQSPFVVSSMIKILATGHVKVQAGVKILFSHQGGLQVSGMLEVNGLSGNPVIFSSSSSRFSQPSRWLGIEVSDQGKLALEHCDIHEAITGINGPLSSITVRHCHIHHNEIGVGLSAGDVDKGRTQFVGTKIVGNRKQGITGEGWTDGQNVMHLKDCEFLSNEHALFLGYGASVIGVENCVFSDNAYGTYLRDSEVDITIQNCSYTNNSKYGLYYHSDSASILRFNIAVNSSWFGNNTYGIGLYVENVSDKSELSISNSYLSNTESSVTIYGQNLHETSVVLRNNTVASALKQEQYPVAFICYGNNISMIVESNVFNALLYLDGGHESTYLVLNNTFNNLKGENGLRIGRSKVHILNNRFNNCTTHSVIYTQDINTVISGNSFQNPNAQYDVMADIAFTEDSRLNATHNYWGRNDKFFVRSRISDFFHDMNHVIADVHPFYMADDEPDLSTEMDSDIFSFESKGVIGGKLNESVTLGPHQNLVVTRSLHIPEGYKLTILQNVTLFFPFKQGVFVEGVLEIQGKKDGLVVLTNERTDDIHWSGVYFNSTGSTLKYTLLKNAGIKVMTNKTGAIILSDSIITQVDTAVDGQLWARAQLSLHRVKVRATSKAVHLENHTPDTISIDFLRCDFNGSTYLQSYGEGGDLSVSIESTTLSGLFQIESCESNINMKISNTTFIEQHCLYCRYAVSIKGGHLHVLMRNISVTGQTFLATCGFIGNDTGLIDIQDSTFNQTENAFALQIATFMDHDENAPHSIHFLNNTLYSTFNKGLNLGIMKYSSPWNIVVAGNMFNGAGIGYYGSIAHASLEGNIFVHATTVLSTNVMCKENSTTTLKKNIVHRGTLTLYSERSDDTFYLQKNWFNGTEVILENPRSIIHENTFIRGSKFDIKFEGQGYADKEINCTLNYWDTTDRKDIDKRLYDSSYDKRLPTIIFDPFYEIKYNCSETLNELCFFPQISVLNVIPSSGPNSGGTRVHIFGHNFPETNNGTFYCRFDKTVVNGTRLTRQYVICHTPQHPNGEITVEISPDGHLFTQNKTKFTFYDECQPGICMENLIPPHGSCLHGECLCSLPWSGTNCSIELKAPVISLDSKNLMADEGDEFRLQPNLTQGNEPFEWLLSGSPSGMKINPRTGLISWDWTVASGEPYRITITATNRVGHSDVVFSLTVPLSYNVTIDELLPSGLLPVPKSVKIKGHVSSLNGRSRPLVAFVDIKIRNRGRIISKIPVSTSLNTKNKFEALYFPKVGDSGLFEVDGRHPSNSGFTAQRSWRVLGMRCVPSYTSRQAYLDTGVVEMRDVTVLRNVGIDTIKNITAIVEGAGGPLTFVIVSANKTLSNEVSRPLIQTLAPDSVSMIGLILTASTPLHGTIGVVFSTAEGTIARVRVKIGLNIRKPVLVTSPQSLHDNVPRGRQGIYQIFVDNVGEVPATSLKVILPSEKRLAISAFSNSRGQASDSGLDLQPNETAILVLTFTVGFTDPLGEITGSVALNSDLASAPIPYRFYVTSLERLNFTVRVEDEFTYFASDKPLVSGAAVVLKNPLKGYKQKIITKTSGLVVFENILEDQYTLQATAPGHSSYSAVIIAKPSDSSFSIFLQRVAVTYTWTVTPTTFEDKYIITLDSTFETHVPMPVVTVEPAVVNLIPYEDGKKDVINFNITNHGLIRADNVRLLLKQGHPTLVFTQAFDPIGPVDANTSIIVQVLVSTKARVKRDIAGFISCLNWKLWYDYFCGQTRTAGQDITLTRQNPGRPPVPCGGLNLVSQHSSDTYSGETYSGETYSVETYSGISGNGYAPAIIPSTSTLVYKPVTPVTCGCGKALINCLLNFVKLNAVLQCVDALGSIKDKNGGLLNTVSSCIPFPSGKVKCGLAFGSVRNANSIEDIINALLDIISSCIPLPLPATFVINTAKCINAWYAHCKSNRSIRATDSDAVQEVIDSNVHIWNFLLIIKEVYGEEDMFRVNVNSWLNSFNMAVAEDSPIGKFLSQSEITSITAPLNTSFVSTVQKFLTRWNNTVTALEDGTPATLGPEDNIISYNIIMTRSEQFRKDTKIVNQRGFDSIFAAFDNAVKDFKAKQEQATSDDGVCAKVRVRIVQDLVLTRDAFNARLEIENGEKSALENIAVFIHIWPTHGNKTLKNSQFSFGNVTLVGITGVDGSGRLERDMSGTAEWLIIPYSTAAVEHDTLYNVGGTLSYTVDGSKFSIQLLPDTITVKPNPSLILNYFHEKYVQGDDPMTINVTESVVPFTLAVMVSNGAYGVARQLKITSAQPEIIENEKGLLVSFKIIGAQLGKDPVTPSLSINFGDVESFETKTARWLLTCPLKGKFFNFTATFENINPLGDPQLSIMESVGYHQLIHLVRLESAGDDLDDFLVNDVADAEEMADSVYDSSDGFNNSHVASTVVNSFSLWKTEAVGNKTYQYVNLSVTVLEHGNNGSAYIYSRLVNNLTRDSLSESLLMVIRDDSKKILVGSNAWQTNYYHNKFYLHVFDFVDNLNISNTVKYSLLFGPKFSHRPTKTTEIYGVVTSQPTKTSEIPTVVTSITTITSEISNVVTPISLKTSEIPGVITPISAQTNEIPGVVTPMFLKTSEITGVVTPISLKTSEIPSVITPISAQTNEIPGVVTPIFLKTSEITGVVTPISLKTSEIPGIITPISAQTNEIPGGVTPIFLKTSEIPGVVTPISAKTSEIPGDVTPISLKTSEIPGVITPISVKTSEITGVVTPISPKTSEIVSVNTPISARTNEIPGVVTPIPDQTSERYWNICED